MTSQTEYQNAKQAQTRLAAHRCRFLVDCSLPDHLHRRLSEDTTVPPPYAYPWSPPETDLQTNFRNSTPDRGQLPSRCLRKFYRRSASNPKMERSSVSPCSRTDPTVHRLHPKLAIAPANGGFIHHRRMATRRYIRGGKYRHYVFQSRWLVNSSEPLLSGSQPAHEDFRYQYHFHAHATHIRPAAELLCPHRA